MKGIDVSNYQGKIDWTKVKAAGYGAAAIKASEGVTFVDQDFMQNAEGARGVGLETIYYHYGHPSNDPVAEANHFLSVVQKAGLPTGPLVLDIEENDGVADVSAWVVAFLDHLHSQTGHAVAWYTYDSFIGEHMSKVHIDYPDWLASYGAKPDYKWFAWQFTDKGKVPGINGYVDVDEFTPAFLQEAPVPTVAPAVPPVKVAPPQPPVEEKKPTEPVKHHKTITFLMHKGNVITLVVAVVGATKLILQAFGINLGITSEEANSIADAVAGVATTMGIFMTHSK